MKKNAFFLLLFCLMVVLPGCGQQYAIVGKWAGTWTNSVSPKPQDIQMTFKPDGTSTMTESSALGYTSGTLTYEINGNTLIQDTKTGMLNGHPVPASGLPTASLIYTFHLSGSTLTMTQQDTKIIMHRVL